MPLKNVWRTGQDSLNDLLLTAHPVGAPDADGNRNFFEMLPLGSGGPFARALSLGSNISQISKVSAKLDHEQGVDACHERAGRALSLSSNTSKLSNTSAKQDTEQDTDGRHERVETLHHGRNDSHGTVHHGRNDSQGTVHTMSEHEGFYHPAVRRSPRDALAASQANVSRSASGPASFQTPSDGRPMSTPETGASQMQLALQQQHDLRREDSLRADSLAMMAHEATVRHGLAIDRIKTTLGVYGDRMGQVEVHVGALQQMVRDLQAGHYGMQQDQYGIHQRLDIVNTSIGEMTLASNSTHAAIQQTNATVQQNNAATNAAIQQLVQLQSASTTPNVPQHSTFAARHHSAPGAYPGYQQYNIASGSAAPPTASSFRMTPSGSGGNSVRTPSGNALTHVNGGMTMHTPNPADDVFAPSTGSGTNGSVARFPQKEFGELVRCITMRLEGFVRAFMTVMVSTKSRNPSVQHIVQLGAIHIDHRGMAITMLEDKQMRTHLMVGIVNRWVTENIYDHPLLSHYANQQLVSQFLAVFDEEARMQGSPMTANQYAKRKQLAEDRARFALCIIQLPGFWQWAQELAHDLTDTLIREIMPLIAPAKLTQARAELYKHINEAVKLALRMRQEPKFFVTSFYRYGSRWDHKGMVQKNEEMRGLACDEAPPIWVLRVTMAPYFCEKSFTATSFSVRVLQKGEVTLCDRKTHLR